MARFGQETFIAFGGVFRFRMALIGGCAKGS